MHAHTHTHTHTQTDTHALTAPLALDPRLTGGARNPLSHSHPLFTWNNKPFCVCVCVCLSLVRPLSQLTPQSSVTLINLCVCVSQMKLGLPPVCALELRLKSCFCAHLPVCVCECSYIPTASFSCISNAGTPSLLASCIPFESAALTSPSP